MKGFSLYITFTLVFFLCVTFYLNNNKLLKVAILDTGVKSSSIKSEVISKDFVQEENKMNMHGTEIVKIIEASNNIVIYDAKVLNHDGNGTVEHTIAGLDWAIKNKVNVINMSYGFTHDYQKLHNKIKEATKKGIIIMVANGNNVFGQKEYPALYQETISIGVLRKDNKKSIFNSNNNADLYITSNDKSSIKVNNTSKATAFATNHLLKVYNEKMIYLDKNEIIRLIHNSWKNSNKKVVGRLKLPFSGEYYIYKSFFINIGASVINYK